MRTIERRAVARTPRRLVLLVALALAAIVAAPGAVATAQDSGRLDPDELGVTATVGFDGNVVRRGWVPVEVTLAPRRLFAGSIGVVGEHEGGRQVESLDVEVPAGSVKVFRFVLPPSHAIQVRVSEPGTDGLLLSPAFERADAFLVGWLGEKLPLDLPPIRSYPLDQTGTVVAVTPAWLERLGALDPLSALVASPADLQALPATARRHLATAIVGGLDLVVTAEAPGAVDLSPLGLDAEPVDGAVATTIPPDPERRGASGALPVLALSPGPDTWSLTAADLWDGGDDTALAVAATAGRGRVVVTGVDLGGSGLGSDGSFWGRVLQPSGRVGGTVQSGQQGAMVNVAGEGLRSEGVDLPPIGWFALFLVAFVLVVGPLNGLVLSRIRRRELAWLTVPAITLVFAGGAWFASAGSSPSLGVAGRAAYWLDGAGAEVVASALRSPRPDTHRLVFPGDGWEVLSGAWNLPATVSHDARGTTVSMDLEALQVGTAVAHRSIDVPAPLAVTAEVIDDEIHVEVTNTSGEPLEAVEVRAGTASERIGDLPAGASRTHVFTTRGMLPVSQQWHDLFAGLRGPDGLVTAPGSLEALLRHGVLDGRPGVVWVTATSRTRVGLSAVDAGGTPATDQGSFVAVGTTPSDADGRLSPFEVHRDLITTGFGEAWQPGPLAIEGQTDAVLRFRLPGGHDIERLESSLDRGQLNNDGFFDVAHACVTDEVRTDDGDLRAVREICGPEKIIDDIVAACPPDALHCNVNGATMDVCTADGPCRSESLSDELVEKAIGRRIAGLEIWDEQDRAWIAVADAFAESDDGGLAGDAARFVGALGEVYVRVSGQMHPFDFSGRGLGAVLARSQA